MRFNLREVFYFNKTEQRGIIVLVILILLIFTIPYFASFFNRKHAVDFSVMEREIARFEEETARAKPVTPSDSGEIDLARPDYSYARNKLKPFPFNPNNLPEPEWLKLGLNARQVKTIKNYESKGGRFYKKEDLKKIYGISLSEYTLLEPYITIPSETPAVKSASGRTAISGVKDQNLLVDINTADSTELVKIKGIGPVYARRIIKYRELLGGFYTVDQLLEVYGFDAEKLSLVASNCQIGTGVFRKFDLNSAGINDLRKHPYLDYYIAKAIVDKRISEGKYSNINELNKIPLIHSDLFDKISNYVYIR